jgi:hypothetical protein
LEKLDINKWRACLTLPVDYTPPSGAILRMGIDPSPTANPDSDESAIAVGHFCEADPWPGLALLDCVAGRYKGMLLPDKIVDLMELWIPEEISIECNRQHGGELLVDAIEYRAKDRGIAIPRITSFSASNKFAAKVTRVCRIESELIDHGLLKIRQAGFIDKLFDEVRNFSFDPENHGRLDSCLDALAFLAGFR